MIGAFEPHRDEFIYVITMRWVQRERWCDDTIWATQGWIPLCGYYEMGTGRKV